MRRLLSARNAVRLAVLLAVLPIAAYADEGLDLDHIRVRYYGGPVLQHVRVSTFFWGSSWKQNQLTNYFNNFLVALFEDGRFMANLAQYSVPDSPIGNGEFISTGIDTTDPSARVSDEQIQEEIGARIADRTLPQPDADTLYVVFTPPRVVVTTEEGDSARNFDGYHYYSFDGQEGEFAYAVIPYKDRSRLQSELHQQPDPRLMTTVISHELAEAVTDPQPFFDLGTMGWTDWKNGEIGDIPIFLYDAGWISADETFDRFEDSAGTTYWVQKQWSVKDGTPVAFAIVN
jgi:hypothetical protein